MHFSPFSLCYRFFAKDNLICYGTKPLVVIIIAQETMIVSCIAIVINIVVFIVIFIVRHVVIDMIVIVFVIVTVVVIKIGLFFLLVIFSRLMAGVYATVVRRQQ